MNITFAKATISIGAIAPTKHLVYVIIMRHRFKCRFKKARQSFMTSVEKYDVIVLSAAVR